MTFAYKSFKMLEGEFKRKKKRLSVHKRGYSLISYYDLRNGFISAPNRPEHYTGSPI